MHVLIVKYDPANEAEGPVGSDWVFSQTLELVLMLSLGLALGSELAINGFTTIY